MSEATEWVPLLYAISWVATGKEPEPRACVRDRLGRRLADAGLLDPEIEEQALQVATEDLWRAAASGKVRLRGRGPWAVASEHNPDARCDEWSGAHAPLNDIEPKLLTSPGLGFFVDGIGPTDWHDDIKAALRWSEVEVHLPSLKSSGVGQHRSPGSASGAPPPASTIATAVARTIGSETRLQDWLIAKMRASPDKPQVKEETRTESEKMGHEVGVRAFDRAWRRAVEETGAVAWSRPGRKSGRRIETPS